MRDRDFERNSIRRDNFVDRVSLYPQFQFWCISIFFFDRKDNIFNCLKALVVVDNCFLFLR